jgi:probable rRNA maturation factor
LCGKDGGVIIIRKKVPGLSENALKRFAARAIAAAGMAGNVNVLVTDNRELRSLNRRFRKKDAATDVLSFPAEIGVSNDIAGDIAISAEMAAANARKLGHSAADEIKILILHGALHLGGYDHERDNGTMGRREAQLRRAFKLPVGLIERYGLNRNLIAKTVKKSRGT